MRRAAAIAASAALAVGATAQAPARQPEDRRIEVVQVVAPLGEPDATLGGQETKAASQAAARGVALSEFLRRNLASVFVNEAQGNPLQPDLQYRGFVASPLLGLPQGLAVYQDGARVNEPFGDTVHWALLPESAIAAAALLPASNPLFGLNALGGALALRTKDGFRHPGARAALSAGSFGRRNAALQGGGARENLAGYGALSALREDGWRDFSPSALARAFGKASWRGANASLDASGAFADADLIGNGASPEALLALRRAAIFTRPDRTRHQLAQWNLALERDFGPKASLRGNLYWRDGRIATYNGDDSDYEACDDDFPPGEPALLCLEDGDEAEVVHDRGGRPVIAREALEGATINRTRTAQSNLGFGLEMRRQGAAFGRGNALNLGFALTSARIRFASSTELGALDETRQAIPGDVFVGDAFIELNARLETQSLYIADVLELTPNLRLAAAARYNRASVKLRDALGTRLSGDHRFRRVNPSLRLDYAHSPRLALYAGYGESNRAPSPVELTCADEDAPCRLPNAFVADPPLKQVAVRTWEMGASGDGGAMRWRLAAFRARNQDDILFVSAGSLASEGYFDNVGATERRGVELSLNGEAAAGRLRWFVHCTKLSATFEEAFAVASVNHPNAADGEIAVRPGDRLPLVPERLLKAGLEFRATARLEVAVDVFYAASSHLRGDEANLTPAIPGHRVVNARVDYAISPATTLFASVDNALDEEYATFGVFGEADEVLGEDFGDPRFLTPAAPLGIWVGLEVRRGSPD